MNCEFQAAYLPIGVPTFHLESAQMEFEKSRKLLQDLTEGMACPKKMLLSIESLDTFLDGLSPELVIVQNVTFANAAYISEVLKRFACPVLLWTLREPMSGGKRLKLNSLTGAYSAGNALMYMREGNFEYIFGGTKEKRVQDKIRAMLRAVKLKKKLKSLKLASVGDTPQGFGFGRAVDMEMLAAFGVTLLSVEARELMDVARQYTPEECAKCLEETSARTKGFAKMPQKNQVDYSRLCKAYQDYITKNQIGALSSRCWPDFFAAYGTPVCVVLAMLNDLGIAASCEADSYGALSMYMGMQLTGEPVFFGDPVSLNEEENTITYWHCGTAACSLAREPEGAVIGVHPNRKIGPVMDFGCKPADHVTIFRIGKKADGGFRFFLAGGSALDKPRQFSGTSVTVQTKHPVLEVVDQSVQDGWEPHFVIAYGDVKAELAILAHMLDIEVLFY